MKDKMAAVCDALIESALRSEELQKLSNQAIADRLRDEVWVNLDIFSPGADITSAAIERLRDLEAQDG
jgi:hypothetical protein